MSATLCENDLFSTPVLCWTLQCVRLIHRTCIMLDTAVRETYSLTSIMLDTAVCEVYSSHLYYVGHCSVCVCVCEAYSLHQHYVGHSSLWGLFITPALCWTLQCVRLIHHTCIMLDTAVCETYPLHQYYFGHCAVCEAYSLHQYYVGHCAECEAYSLHQFYVGHCAVKCYTL